MERKHRRVKVRKEPGPPDERVRWLLETLWSGNKSAMARDVGCSHTVLVKIAAGERSPGRDLLTRIAEHPKVNPAWLFSGTGEPLLAEQQEQPTEGWPIPITNALLPGAPSDFSEMLGQETFPVAGAAARGSRYFYRVPATEPLVANPGEKVCEGDLLLMDSDRGLWERNLRYLDRKFCCIRRGSKGSESLWLARITCPMEGQAKSVRLRSALSNPAAFDESPAKTSAAKSKDAAEAAKHLTVNMQIKIADVVAVAVMLIRPFA